MWLAVEEEEGDMVSRRKHAKTFKRLSACLASVENPDDMYDFLYGILTPAERAKIALRWELVRLLAEGRSQRTIADLLGISLCKITRGSRELKKGRPGFRKVVKAAIEKDAS